MLIAVAPKVLPLIAVSVRPLPLSVSPNLRFPDCGVVDWRPHASEHLLLGKANHLVLSLICKLSALKRAAH